MNAEQAAQLRAPFPADLIGTLPKAGKKMKFVGHAPVTDRLLQVDPEWTWEPMGVDQHGLPAFDQDGGLWIWLTVCGVRRPGYGEAGTNAPQKEVIGDAIRNAAMRFGVALDLWNEDLAEHTAQVSQGNTEREPVPERKPLDPNVKRNFQGAYLGLKSLVGADAANQFVADTLREKGAKKFDDLSSEDAEIVLARIEDYRIQMAEGVPA